MTYPAKQSKCRSCDAPIIWAKTTQDKNIPLDAEPSGAGNITLVPGGRAHVHSRDELFPQGETLYVSHFVTCPNANEHRKAR